MKVNAPNLGDEIEDDLDAKKTLIRDEALIEVSVARQNLCAIKVKAASISRSKLEKVDLSESELDRFTAKDVVISGCELAGSNFAESGWRSALISRSRCSGAQLYKSSLKDVVFQECKLDLVNFRYSKLENVIFRDCLLDDTDFYCAQLKNVEFDNCTIVKIEVSSVKMKDVDFTSSELGIFKGISGLKGATINSLQLINLAPFMAQEMEIIVKNEYPM